MAFDSIPADLVLKMFEHLPLKDRVRLRGVNRFNEVSDRSINTMRSLEINDDLMNYVNMSQPFPSLLESVTVTNRSINMWMLSALANFVYPKLESLEITVINNEITKRLISRNQNLRSVILHLDREFELPEDIVQEKLEKLEIHSSEERNDDSCINLTPTLRPLIGMVPNLKCLEINRESKWAPFILSVQELNQLLATAPCLEILRLNLFHASTSGPFINMYQDFITAIPTWHLPKLTFLLIALKYPIPSTILQHFPTSFPQLETFLLGMVTQIDDQSLVALLNLNRLRVLGLPYLEMSKDKFIKMITLLPSMNLLYIHKINREAGIMSLPHHQHLHTFSVDMEMTVAEIIDIIAKVPLLSVLKISAILDAGSQESFTDFLTSTAALFHRNLEIRLDSMRIDGNESELDQMKAILEEFQTNGGPVVVMDDRDINVIRYKSLA